MLISIFVILFKQTKLVTFTLEIVYLRLLHVFDLCFEDKFSYYRFLKQCP